MKRLAITLIGSLLIFTFTACEQMPYKPYSGQNQAWPTGGGFADKVFDVPVFRSWPERPYTVLGHVSFSNPRINPNEGDVKQMAKQAKAMGGDALLMLAKNDMSSAGVAKLRQELGIASDYSAGVVIKWK
jgi:hypothetical protein